MSTREPITPSKGFERRWLATGLRLLWAAPLFAFVLAAGPIALGLAIAMAWEALVATAGMPTLPLSMLAIACTTGLGAALLAPLSWCLFFADGQRLPLTWIGRAAGAWGLTATAFSLAISLLLTIPIVAAGQTDFAATPLDLLAVPDGAVWPLGPLVTLGAAALTKGLLALLVVGPYSMSFGLPEEGSLAFGALFSRKTCAKAPAADIHGLFFVGCVALGSIFVPFVGLLSLAILLPWIHVGAREMSGGGLTNSAPATLLSTRPNRRTA